MSRGVGSSDIGHERAHDPCRADWEDVTADHADASPMPWLVAGIVVALLAVAATWVVTVL